MFVILDRGCFVSWSFLSTFWGHSVKLNTDFSLMMLVPIMEGFAQNHIIYILKAVVHSNNEKKSQHDTHYHFLME